MDESSVVKTLLRIFLRTGKSRGSGRRTCYYPAFGKRDDLRNHYFRARWYLPRVEGVCESVIFGVPKLENLPNEDERPREIGSSSGDYSHFRGIASSACYAWSLAQAGEILVWDSSCSDSETIAILKRSGKRIWNVDTAEVKGREYAVYCEMLWWMTPEARRKEIVEENRERFNDYALDLKGGGIDRGFVFGNGPSLKKCIEYRYENSVRVMCNSIVSNDEILDVVRPQFIVAGDPMWHFGCSSYSEAYRSDLVRQLKSRDMRLVIPEFQGYILSVNLPEVRDRIFLIPLAEKRPNLDLLSEYRIPLFWSVLNSCMLPIASSFCDKVYLLGCDGKPVDDRKEGFWAHASGVQYTGLEAEGHKCHPTFEQHRMAHPEYQRVMADLSAMIEEGEEGQGKQYRTLTASYMAPLFSRLVNLESSEDNDSNE
ncbi:hypothetical protein VDG1235_1213 [Verrucomicrobiia bacterium DG1235]|nr:hypothetical protein VDG1235_1213 [Verrucomicrobiae bacterium DG1235]